MSRYRRVNIDGQSLFKTETRTIAAAASAGLLPGTFVAINADDQFAQIAEAAARMYVLESAYHQGLGITDAIPANHSAVGNYIEDGREFAVLVGPGTYKKDQPLIVGSNGRAAAVPTSAGTYQIFGFSQDDVTVASGTTDFIRVRVRADTVTVS